KANLHWVVRIMKIIHPKRWKISGFQDKAPRWFAQRAIALFLSFAALLIGLVLLTGKPPGKISLISQPAAPEQQPPRQPESSEGRPNGGPFRQETRVVGLMAELTRFVYAGSFITAEVTFRNSGSRPATFCCDDWLLVDEQTGDKPPSDTSGGSVNCFQQKTLAPGETHVAWTKFRSGAFSGDKYSLNIDTILNRPF